MLKLAVDEYGDVWKAQFKGALADDRGPCCCEHVLADADHKPRDQWTAADLAALEVMLLAQMEEAHSPENAAKQAECDRIAALPQPPLLRTEMEASAQDVTTDPQFAQAANA